MDPYADPAGRNLEAVLATAAGTSLPERDAAFASKRLTDECIRFARECGYRRMTLWTHSVLTAARHVYEPRRSFGQDVVSEHWDMSLAEIAIRKHEVPGAPVAGMGFTGAGEGI